MKRFLLLGAIALMFTTVSCSNDDDVQEVKATESIYTEVLGKPTLPDPNAQYIPYADLSEGEQNMILNIDDAVQRNVQIPDVLCGKIFINIGYYVVIGYYNGHYYLVTIPDGNPTHGMAVPVSHSWALHQCGL